jgi:hypothetical protein
VNEQEQVAQESTTEPTLDDVYKQFNVEEEAQSFSPQPTQQTAPQPSAQPTAPPSIPDPVLDGEGFKAWLQQDHSQKQLLQQTLSQVAGKLNQYDMAARLQREEADISKAVESFNSHLGDGKVDPDFAEVALGAKARKDPKFRSVWEKRNQNPTAWNAALKAYAKEFGTKHAMRTDPQIAENVRALKEATTSTKATTDSRQTNTARDRMANGTEAEFQREWNQLLGRTA